MLKQKTECELSMWKFLMLLLLSANQAAAAEREFYVATAPNGDRYFISSPHSFLLNRDGVFSADMYIYKAASKHPEKSLLKVTGCREYGGDVQIGNGKKRAWAWRKEGQEFALDIIPTKVCRASGYKMRFDEPPWPDQGRLGHWPTVR